MFTTLCRAGSAAPAATDYLLETPVLLVLQGKNGEVTYVFEPACQLGAKLAGVHWWFKSRAHAAELTAGYYNTRERNGYSPLMDVLKKYHTHLSFTCVEMRDCEHPPEGRCSPQG